MVSAFYALQDTKTPVKVAVVALVANLVASLLLMGPLRHGGLALALSLASSLQFCLLIFLFRKKVAEWDLGPILVSAGKCIFASLIMGLVVYYLYSGWWVPNPASGTWHLAATLAGLILLGVIIYFLAAKALGCSELTSIFGILKPLLRRNKIRNPHP